MTLNDRCHKHAQISLIFMSVLCTPLQVKFNQGIPSKRPRCELTETGRRSSSLQRCSASSRAGGRTHSVSIASWSCVVMHTTVCADALLWCSVCCSWWGYVCLTWFYSVWSLLHDPVFSGVFSVSMHMSACRCWRPVCLTWRTSRT